MSNNNSVRGSAVNGSTNTRPRRQNSSGNNMRGRGVGRRREAPTRANSVRSNSAWRNTQNNSGTNMRSPSNMSNNLRANVERARRALERARNEFQTVQQAAHHADMQLVNAELVGQPRHILNRMRRRMVRLSARYRRRFREMRRAGNLHNALLERWNNLRGPARRNNSN